MAGCAAHWNIVQKKSTGELGITLNLTMPDGRIVKSPFTLLLDEAKEMRDKLQEAIEEFEGMVALKHDPPSKFVQEIMDENDFTSPKQIRVAVDINGRKVGLNHDEFHQVEVLADKYNISFAEAYMEHFIGGRVIPEPEESE